jgi:hypothetical protein
MDFLRLKSPVVVFITLIKAFLISSELIPDIISSFIFVASL